MHRCPTVVMNPMGRYIVRVEPPRNSRAPLSPRNHVTWPRIFRIRSRIVFLPNTASDPTRWSILPSIIPTAACGASVTPTACDPGSYSALAYIFTRSSSVLLCTTNVRSDRWRSSPGLLCRRGMVLRPLSHSKNGGWANRIWL